MTRESAFTEGWSWFKFKNLGLAQGMNLKFYTSVAKGLKLKVKKFSGLVPTFVEVTGGKLVGGGLFIPPILNRVKKMFLSFERWSVIVSQIFRNKFYPGRCKSIRHLLKIKR